MSKRIKLEDIAKELNTTKVTVSKALRDHPDISAERKKIIREKANELGYIPNLAARNLSARSTNTIGVIVPVISNYFFANVIEALYREAHENGYEIILAVSQENSEVEKKHIETMLSMRVDCIVISVVENSQNHQAINNARNLNVPILFFDRTLKVDDTSSVTSDNITGAYLATKKALESGHKNILHFGGKDNSNIDVERFSGFKKAMREYNFKDIDKHRIRVGYSELEGKNAFQKLIDNGKIPDCIFAVTFPVALGIYKAANKSGLKITKDFDLICFGHSDINEYLCPSITCVDHDPSEFGAAVFETALIKIRDEDNTVIMKKVSPKLLEFDTCK